jgi:hypothetical protein
MAGREEQERKQQRVDRERESEDAAGRNQQREGRGISPSDPAEGARDANDDRNTGSREADPSDNADNPI